MAGVFNNLRNFAEFRTVLVQTYTEWDRDQAPRLGAALSYYTVLSLAPLLILLIAITGLAFGEEAARGQLFGQIKDLVGTDGAKAIEEMVQNAGKPGSGVLASVIGFVTLLVGASSVAGELKYDLNTIWKVKADPDSGVKDLLKQRSSALGVVLGGGFLLLVSLAVSSVISGVGTWFSELLPLPGAVLQVINFIVGLAVITGVFAVLFRFLPDLHIQWRDVLLGALFTSVLFSIGKYLIGLYLGKASFGSTYGAAGSLVIVLVWVYYSSQIFFFGAEFTQVYASTHGSDPLKRRAGNVPEVQSAPKPVGALPAQAAGTLGAEEKVTGVFGTLLGSAMAATRVFRGLRR